MGLAVGSDGDDGVSILVGLLVDWDVGDDGEGAVTTLGFPVTTETMPLKIVGASVGDTGEGWDGEDIGDPVVDGNMLDLLLGAKLKVL